MLKEATPLPFSQETKYGQNACWTPNRKLLAMIAAVAVVALVVIGTTALIAAVCPHLAIPLLSALAFNTLLGISCGSLTGGALLFVGALLAYFTTKHTAEKTLLDPPEDVDPKTKELNTWNSTQNDTSLPPPASPHASMPPWQTLPEGFHQTNITPTIQKKAPATATFGLQPPVSVSLRMHEIFFDLYVCEEDYVEAIGGNWVGMPNGKHYLISQAPESRCKDFSTYITEQKLHVFDVSTDKSNFIKSDQRTLLTGWSDHGIVNLETLDGFVDALEAKATDWGVLIHCRAGMGRSCSLVAAHALRQLILSAKDEELNDTFVEKAVLQCVYELRRQRTPNAIESKQYQMLLSYGSHLVDKKKKANVHASTP